MLNFKEIYLYEDTTPQGLKDAIMDTFGKSRGENRLWFKFIFVSPVDERETDYIDQEFTFAATKEVMDSACNKIIVAYRDWLLKTSPPYRADYEQAKKALDSIKQLDRPLKDSGERRDFATGSRRDVATGKGRYDLLPFEVIDALAKHYEKGAAKYGDDNWKKGQPLSVYLDSGLRHAFRWSYGMTDEDHLIAAIWNLVAAWWTQDKIMSGELPVELGDAGELKKALTKKKE